MRSTKNILLVLGPFHFSMIVGVHWFVNYSIKLTAHQPIRIYSRWTQQSINWINSNRPISKSRYSIWRGQPKMQPPLSQSMSSLKVNNHGNRGTTKHFWLIKSLSKLFPFAELSVLEVAQLLRIPRRLVLSTCTFDGQLPFKTTTWLWGSCTGRERSTRAQPRWRRRRGTKDLCENAQGLLPCTRSQKLLRHACCRPGFSLRPVE